MSDLAIRDDIIAEIAARLDLRDPNREAVRTIDLRGGAKITSQFCHWGVDLGLSV
jgi:hypothetical protein